MGIQFKPLNKIHQFWCYLVRGHDLIYKVDQSEQNWKVHVECLKCGYESKGWGNS